jgi:FixJ family two-component response regulator
MPKVILVVHDDDLVRETAVVLIESLGYGAVNTPNGADKFVPVPLKDTGNTHPKYRDGNGS